MRFRKISKSDSLVSSFLSVCPSAWKNSAPTERIFMKVDILGFFENLLRKIEVSLKSDNNKGHSAWRPIYISYHISFRLRMRNASGKSCGENQNTHFVFINFFFRKSCRLWEIVEKNIVERGRPQMTIWRMRTACWMPSATNIHPKYVTLLAFPL